MRLLFAICLIACVRGAAAQADSGRNAAVTYRQAIERYNQWREASPDQVELLMSYISEDGPGLTPEVRAALSQARPILELARGGTAAEHCQFPLERDQGMWMLLPHLSGLRGLAKLMKADALVKLNDGDGAGAAANYADLYRMSGHLRDDRILISSLVGNAIFGLADSSTQQAIDQGRLGAAESQAILEGLDRLSLVDPFDYAGAVQGEKETFGGWLQRQFDEGIEPARIFMGLQDGEVPEEWEDDGELAFMTPEYFERELGLYNDMMDRMISAFKMPDHEAAKEEVAVIEREIERLKEQSEFTAEGLLASMFMPALGKVIERRNQSEKMLAERRAVLQMLASGRKKPEELANAALWYVRGAEMVDRLDPAALQAIRTFAADTSAPISDELADLLQGESAVAKAVAEIIDTFRAGSRKGRCDFSFTRPEWRRELGFVPVYAPGMHDAFRIFYCDAVRLLRDGGTQEQALDRLATCLRMPAHLADDPILISALMSHCNFNRAIDLAGTALTNGMLTDEAKPALREAVEKMNTKDPFGLIGAVLATREKLGKHMGQYTMYLTGEYNPEAGTRVTEKIKALNGDQLLYLLVVRETLQQNGAPASDDPGSEQTKSSLMDNLSRLGDVLSIPDIEAVQREITDCAPMLARYEFDFLNERTIPAVAYSMEGRYGRNYIDHVRRANGDLRRGHQIFRAAAEPRQLIEKRPE